MKQSALLKWGLLAGGAALGAAIMLRKQRPQFSVSGKVILITGGSRGLGLVLARKLGRAGARIAICARNHQQLQRAEQELRHTAIETFARTCDVTDRSAVKQLIESIVQRWGRIDVVINNAGVIQMGPLDSQTEDDFATAINTHVWGPLNVITEVLPHMRARHAGRILNIASIGGKMSIPHLLPYCTSKFALVGLSEGFATELAGEGIVVTTVCPGLMRTGSHRNALFKGRHREEFAWFSIAGALPFSSMSAEYAADQIIDAMRRGSSHLVVGPLANLATKIHDLAPGFVVWANGLVNSLLPRNVAGGTRIARGAESQSVLSPSLLTAMADSASVQNNELD